MPAYNFQSAFADDVESGRKRLTLRRERKPPARHAFLGEPVNLWTGLRTNSARLLASGVVICRATLTITPRGIGRVLCAFDRMPRDQPRLLDMLISRDGELLARLDGFASYAAAWHWHDTHRTEREADFLVLTRELIAWKLRAPERPAMPPPAAAIPETAAQSIQIAA